MNLEELRRHFSALSDEALAEAMTHRDEYTPEAFEVARQEAQARGLFEKQTPDTGSDRHDARMPDVVIRADIDEIFATARDAVYRQKVRPGDDSGRRFVIITPDREQLFMPGPPPGSMPSDDVAAIEEIVPSDTPKFIAVIADTSFEDPDDVPDLMSSIPCLGFLVALAYVGHTVWVFEGHPSAYTSGVRDSDMLVVDSRMLPCLQDDWARVAVAHMRQAATIIIYEAERADPIHPVVPSGNSQGWQFAEPDGERSYANCLLITLARSKDLSVVITEGQPVPDLADLATEPEERHWVAALPFQYDRLDAGEIIRTIVAVAERPWYAIHTNMLVLDAVVQISPDEQRELSFKMDLGRDEDGRTQLRIKK